MDRAGSLSRDRLIELVNSIQDAQDDGRPVEDLISLLERKVSCPDARNLCNSKYSAETIVDLCLGWDETQRVLNRDELIELVHTIRSGRTDTEAEHMLLVQTFIYNCRHKAKSDLIFYPAAIFDFQRDPTLEEIVDKAISGEEDTNKSEAGTSPTASSSAGHGLDRSKEDAMLQQLFDKTESPQFSASMTAASNLKRFVHSIITQLDPFTQFMKKSDLAQQRVFERLIELADRNDANSVRRWDVAVAVYLWLLGSISHDLVARAIPKVMEYGELSWSRKMAEYWRRFMELGRERSQDDTTVA